MKNTMYFLNQYILILNFIGLLTSEFSQFIVNYNVSPRC